MFTFKKIVLVLAACGWFTVNAQTAMPAKPLQLYSQNSGKLSPHADAQRVRAVLAELVHRGLAANTNAVEWFALSDSELIVNGITQSAALQHEFETKFSVQAAYGLYYGPVQITGKGFFVDKQELAVL